MLEIKQVNNNKQAKECDKLLTELFESGSTYDNNIKGLSEIKGYYKNLYKSDYNIIYLAYMDKLPVGYISGYIKIEAGEDYFNSVAKIDYLYVKKEYRKQGIATELLKNFYEWCREKNIKLVDIGVYKENKKAINLYKKEKFKLKSYEMRKHL